MAAHTPRPEQPELLVPDVAAWRAWLDEHEDTSDGVWLVLAKKGAAAPTTLVYATALDEALCSGWIDGQARSVDDRIYRQRFTPRRQRSMWSARNVTYVARLTTEGRMRPRGIAEVERAQADGRWDAAYAGPATAVVPPDLEAALDATPAARAAFDALDATNRYAILHRVGVPRTEKGRAAAVERLVGRLAEGWLPHPKP
ncbi:YdeI/OmpD-associated family protein [Cellulomonas marina]|uniref:Uncharacterized conserved protein YdeI, YjbR/CyaY-like superfamily, DUF1801 family n=1 Tax=Cellulomonas marina TaxID=988821 RepID=A0A1I0YAM4_9CELL|nr:YdeI/OmpD-associated family protein [Cellulomonas marina]GIG29624.1 hypothetical protein Cma02nite_22240 [Cellulomonas marina]SFB10389.1 Uncharacterized conserved protein YdeI, YjbR/CyaY-like superfamily, DUF1801 family [Cellulomonas marina]